MVTRARPPLRADLETTTGAKRAVCVTRCAGRASAGTPLCRHIMNLWSPRRAIRAVTVRNFKLPTGVKRAGYERHAAGRPRGRPEGANRAYHCSSAISGQSALAPPKALHGPTAEGATRLRHRRRAGVGSARARYSLVSGCFDRTSVAPLAVRMDDRKERTEHIIARHLAAGN